MDEERPSIVVVGAQKASSTTIAAALASHSRVEMLPDEYHGFLTQHYGAHTVPDLISLYAEPSSKRRAFKSASYFADPELPRRLSAELGSPDIVIGLRDPVSRAISAWYWYVRNGYLPLSGAEEGLTALLNGSFDLDSYPHGRDVLEWGLYANNIVRYQEAVGDERVHVLTDLELRANRPAALERLMGRLDLGTEPAVTAMRRRLNEGTYSMWRLRWLRLRLGLIWREDDHGAMREQRPDRVLPWLANAGVVGIDRYFLRFILTNESPSLSLGLRSDLRDFFSDDIARTSALLEQDLTEWGRYS